MSGGGGSNTTVQNADPWSGAQPYLRDIMGRGFEYAENPAAFYPGATYLGPSAGQIAGWDAQLNYADQVYGGARTPKFGEATQALSGALTGQNTLGGYTQSLSPFAESQIRMGFQTGAPQIGDRSSMFRTEADYNGLQGAIQAANAPLMRQFEQEVLPGLNQRATFLGNPTGGIKTLNRVLPELGERMSLNAQTLTEGERQRSLMAGQQAAQFGLNTDVARAQTLGDYRNQTLGLGGLGAQLAGAQSDASLRAAGMFPALVQAGSVPGSLSSQFADWGVGFQQRALQDQMDRFNYYQQLPLASAQQYSGLVSGMGGLGGSTMTRGPGGSALAGALGGAATGAGIAGALTQAGVMTSGSPWGWALMGLGALAGGL